MRSDIREGMLAALKDWQDRVDDDQCNDCVRFKGLCAFFSTYHYRLREYLLGLLRRDFPDNPYYPFGGDTRYLREGMRGTAHKNPLRRAWVQRIIDELTEEQER